MQVQVGDKVQPVEGRTWIVSATALCKTCGSPIFTCKQIRGQWIHMGYIDGERYGHEAKPQ